MKLRTRFVLVMAGFLLLLTALVSMISARLFLAGALALEKEMAREAVESGRHALLLDAAELARQLQGLVSPTPAVPLPADTFRRLRVNLAAFVDHDGRPVYAKGFDTARNAETPPAKTVWPSVLARHRLLHPALPAEPVSGLIAAEDEVWLVAAISTPASGGGTGGTGILLLGRRLGPATDWRPAGNRHGRFAVYPAAQGPVPEGTEIQVTPARTIKGLARIHDLEGRPVITLEATLEQRIFAQGVTSLFLLTGWILLSGAAIGLFAYWVVDRWVLQDLSDSLDTLKRGVAAVTAGAELLPRLKTSRKDEMGMVANSLNAMLEALNRSHQSLRASEEKYRTLVESAPDAIVQLDAEGRVVAGNRAFFERILAHSEASAAGRTLAEAWPGTAAEAILGALARLREGETATLSDLGDTRPGSERWYSASLARAGRSARRESYTLVVLRDETERVRAQRTSESRRQDLIQAQKMTALGTLVAGVAHEVNNPNTVISLNLAALRRRLQALFDALEAHPAGGAGGADARAEARRLRGELEALVSETGEAAARIAALVASLKTFARPASEKMTEGVSVNRLIEQACELMKHTIAKKSCVLRLALTEPLPAVRGNPPQLTQVFMNLIENACDASPGPDAGIEIGTAQEPGGGTVLVTVRDAGSGIAPENIDRIFEPFFTTRRDQGGTGLGLSISSEIIRTHRGRIEVQSVPGRGSLFTVVLPAAPGKDAHAR